MRTFNIRYYDPNGREDETQFDICDVDFVSMFNDLINLFEDFCEETYKTDRTPCEIIRIYEVPYDGEE